jgi:hypothetical protein
VRLGFAELALVVLGSAFFILCHFFFLFLLCLYPLNGFSSGREHFAHAQGQVYYPQAVCKRTSGVADAARMPRCTSPIGRDCTQFGELCVVVAHFDVMGYIMLMPQTLFERGIPQDLVMWRYAREVERLGQEVPYLLSETMALTILAWLEEACMVRLAKWGTPLILAQAIAGAGIYHLDLWHYEDYQNALARHLVQIHTANQDLEVAMLPVQLVNFAQGIPHARELPVYLLQEQGR